MKTIGVLGGLGPQATMDFEARVHNAAQRLIEPSANAGYPPMVVWYCRHPPAVMAERDVPVTPFQIEPRLLEAARRLGILADFLVVPSNGTHVFADEIARAAGRPVLNMVDLAVAEVRRREWRTVGVLTMGEPLVYT
ncbi:MAG TPA: aspartate/glutamate racemase family protein, partial [Tepidisphaeraceae bacterium]|nr:aspartate/glutamate racemase family protein [Tepidisphaeraceae bacterium]